MARKEDGTYAATHGADPEVIHTIMQPDETYTTGELADEVGAPRRTVYKYLCELEEQGRVVVKRPNDRLNLWRKV